MMTEDDLQAIELMAESTTDPDPHIWGEARQLAVDIIPDLVAEVRRLRAEGTALRRAFNVRTETAEGLSMLARMLLDHAEQLDSGR